MVKCSFAFSFSLSLSPKNYEPHKVVCLVSRCGKSRNSNFFVTVTAVSPHNSEHKYRTLLFFWYIKKLGGFIYSCLKYKTIIKWPRIRKECIDFCVYVCSRPLPQRSFLSPAVIYAVGKCFSVFKLSVHSPCLDLYYFLV